MDEQKTAAAPRCTEEQLVRLMFPLLRRKDGKPRKRQIPVLCGMNGQILVIMRGVVVEAPAWVPMVCEHALQDVYECFTSKRKPNNKVSGPEPAAGSGYAGGVGSGKDGGLHE